MRICLILWIVAVPTCLLAQSDSTDWTNDRFWLTIQANFIRQQQPSFRALYSGPNSLSADKEHATSRVETLFTGFRITENLEFFLTSIARGEVA